MKPTRRCWVCLTLSFPPIFPSRLPLFLLIFSTWNSRCMFSHTNTGIHRKEYNLRGLLLNCRNGRRQKRWSTYTFMHTVLQIASYEIHIFSLNEAAVEGLKSIDLHVIVWSSKLDGFTPSSSHCKHFSFKSVVFRHNTSCSKFSWGVFWCRQFNILQVFF